MVLKQNKDREYFSVGTKEDMVISNSFLGALNPEQGGSPQKALAFFDKQDELSETKELTHGSTVHKYAETPDEFAIADIDRPSDTLGNLAESFYAHLNSSILPVDMSTEITSSNKSISANQAHVGQIIDAYDKLAALFGKSPNDIIRIMRLARQETNAYKSYNEDTIVNNFISGAVAYVKQLHLLKNKIALSRSDKDKMESTIASLRSDININKYFALSSQFDDNLVLKEWDIYLMFGGFKVKCRLDNIYIDLKNKLIYLNDLKTTSKPIGLFKDSFDHYRYYRQVSLYMYALAKAIEEDKLFKNVDTTMFTPPDFKDFDIIPQIVAVESTGYYNNAILRIQEDYIRKGADEWTRLVDRFRFHKENNIWDKTREQATDGYTTLSLEV